MAPRTRRSVARPAPAAPKPAPKPTTPQPKATPAPKADFANLAAPVDAPPIAHTRNVELNPFTPHVKASHERGATLMVPVESKDAKQAVNMIRRAAKVLDIGVSVLVVDNKDGTSNVSFAGKARRKYTPRDDK